MISSAINEHRETLEKHANPDDWDLRDPTKRAHYFCMQSTICGLLAIETKELVLAFRMYTRAVKYAGQGEAPPYLVNAMAALHVAIETAITGRP